MDYTAEDVEFLATAAEQAAVAIVAVRKSEPAAQPGTIATVDPLVAAVIHDIKNCVSALSLLARNAAGNLADPEFQRDAVTTLSRTVERMRRLLVKLSSAGDQPPPAAPTSIDLRELLIEAMRPLAADGRVRLVQRLRPVRTVYGDHDALLRVIQNLTTNAAEAIEHEGTVTVTLARSMRSSRSPIPAGESRKSTGSATSSRPSAPPRRAAGASGSIRPSRRSRARMARSSSTASKVSGQPSP
jgi:signal transduction histidine kinase